MIVYVLYKLDGIYSQKKCDLSRNKFGYTHIANLSLNKEGFF